MIKKLSQLIFMIMVFLTTGCIKETYDMNMLSKKMHLSPTMAISAIKGDISLSDIVKSSDTVIFDQNKFVTIIFKKDSVIDLKLADFAKGILVQLIATIDPYTLDLEIGDILNHITGTFGISNPVIKINYSNSFIYPIEIHLNVAGKRKDKTVDLNLAPFTLLHPVAPTDPVVTASFKIDKSNSSLSELMSLPPEKIDISGTATMSISGKNSQPDNYVLGSNRLLGSLQVELPMEFRIKNLQFTDTVDNFLADAFDEESKLNWEDFELFRIDFDVENGFPMGVSLKMNLYDSLSHQVISSIDATDLLKPAPVDGSGKASGVALSSTSIPFTHEFFSSIEMADKIIFQFTLNTTDNGAKDVKIYSDYRIDFKAALVLKPDIKFNLK